MRISMTVLRLTCFFGFQVLDRPTISAEDERIEEFLHLLRACIEAEHHPQDNGNVFEMRRMLGKHSTFTLQQYRNRPDTTLYGPSATP